MIASKVRPRQYSDWSIVPLPIHSKRTQSLNSIHPINIGPKNTEAVDVTQDSSPVRPKTKSSFHCKPLRCWSSMPPCVRGLLLGALTNCLVLAIILPIWLVKPAKTTAAAITSPELRWNSTAITIAGVTNVSGTAANLLNGPYHVVFDSSNTLYISDQNNNRVQKWMFGASSGTTVAGNPNGTSSTALNRLSVPYGIAVDSKGGVYALDYGNSRVTYWASGASSGVIVAGNGTLGNGTNQLYKPRGIALDYNTGTLYVADTDNHRVMSYQAGSLNATLVAGGNGQGTNSTQLNSPRGIYFDALSNSLFIANVNANNIVRWQLGDTQWTIVAGNSNGSSGSTSTTLWHPSDVTFDVVGNMYVADTVNARVQFFAAGQSNGETVAGITRLPGNNASLLNGVDSVALDTQLNMYVADFSNQRIQKFVRY